MNKVGLPTPKVLQKTDEVLQFLKSQGINPQAVSHSVMEGVGITLTSGLKFAYIELLNSEEILFLMDTNGINRTVWEHPLEASDLIYPSIQKLINHLQE